MSITKTQFRWLVIAYVVIPIIGMVVSFAGESLLPAPLRDYLTVQSEADLTVKDIFCVVTGIPLLIAGIISAIGLYRFWRFARPLTVIAWIVGLILQVFAGPTVESGLATSLYELSEVLTGILLAVIYLTPARAWFERTHETQPESGSSR